MTNKKGISDVVTTVLIVLLSIVAIAILWSFLQPMFTKSGAKIQQAEACLSVNLEVTRCVVDGSVTVKRNPGAANLKEIKLIFENPDGSTSVLNSTNVPDELGSVVYPNTLDFMPKSVAVAAGVADAQGVVGYCNPTQPVVCR
jgi:hypothetical protein